MVLQSGIVLTIVSMLRNVAPGTALVLSSVALFWMIGSILSRLESPMKQWSRSMADVDVDISAARSGNS